MFYLITNKNKNSFGKVWTTKQMSYQIFLVFYSLLFLCCQLCEQGLAAQIAEPSSVVNKNTAPDFLEKKNQKIKDTIKAANGLEQDGETTVNSIDFAFLAAADGVIVALAELNFNYGTTQENKEVILAKYIEANKIKWGEEAIENEGKSQWELELDKEISKKRVGNAPIKSFAVVAEDKKIYHITVSNDTFKENVLPEESESSASQWHVRLVKGEFTGSGTKKTIKLETSIISVVGEGNKLNQLKTQLQNLPPSDGFAFVTSKNNIIFIMKGKETTSSSEGAEKNIISVFQLENGINKKTLNLLRVDSVDGCYPSFFQWEGKIIMTPTFCSGGKSHEVKMFDENNKKEFIGSSAPITRLKKFLEDKNNFTTATIKGKKVLLFTQQKPVQTSGKNSVFLWMYDGTRVGFVGDILKNIEGTFYGSFLHTSEGLFALHQKYETGNGGAKVDNTFSFTVLKKQLDKITDTITAWEQSNETVLNLCNNAKGPNIICTTPPPIDGLVGFLHKTINEKTNTIIWKDECFYTNVTVQSGSKEENGLKFGEAGAGAKWLVGETKEDQPYNFTDLGFTLLATVTIDKNDEKSDNSLLGVVLNKNKHFKLWCSKDKKWVVRDEKGETLKQSQITCEQGKTYNVAFILIKDETLEIYVNGEKLNDLPGNKMEKVETIKYFYFGVDSDEATGASAKTYVTVTNVLLYNRPFNNPEIGNLRKYIKSVEVSTTPDESTTPHEDERVPTPLPQGTNENEKSDEKDEKEPSPSRTEDGGVGGGVRVFSLLLAVLCASAPLLHL